MRVVLESHRGRGELPVALDPDVEGTVDHDLRDVVIGEQPLQRPVAEDVICEVLGDLVALSPREAALLQEMTAYVGLHALTQNVGRNLEVEELHAELADDEHVDGVLQLGELVRWRDGAW